MTKLLTAQEVRTITSPQISIDPAYYDNNIEWCQEYDLKPVLTELLFIDFMALYAADPLFPTNPSYKEMYDNYIKYIVAYGTAFYAHKKDIVTKTDNQGLMMNRTQHSESANHARGLNVLMQHKERQWHYLTCLAEYLEENKENADLVLWDEESAVLTPEFRDFIPQ